MDNFFASSTKGAQFFVIVSFLCSILGIFLYGINFSSVGLIVLGYFLYGCLGIVVTFHRLLTHQSFKTHPIFEKIFSILGCLAGTGSSIAWVAIHINHHLKSDKPEDPHSPYYKGYKIFFLDYESEVNTMTKWKMKEIITDKFHQFLHRFYFLIIITWVAILYMIGGFYLLTFFYFVPLFITAFMSNIVNYIGHKPNWLGGFRTYNLADQSTNNWIFAIPSWGETWHNNHHRFPRNYSCGQGRWQIDISAMIITLIRR